MSLLLALSLQSCLGVLCRFHHLHCRIPTADARQKRAAGRRLDEDNVAHKVRGGYGEDRDDELIPDTRWVNLSELVANLDDRSLAVLDTRQLAANGLIAVLADAEPELLAEDPESCAQEAARPPE